jgi:adenylate cyclase
MKKRKVLVVDDETEFVEMVTMRLEANEYEVASAFDGPSGLEKAKEVSPDIVILDVMMPGMDGFQVLRELRKQEKTRYTPVIMLTAKGESKSIFKALDLGATDYLIKPFDSKELLAVLKKHA